MPARQCAGRAVCSTVDPAADTLTNNLAALATGVVAALVVGPPLAAATTVLTDRWPTIGELRRSWARIGARSLIVSGALGILVAVSVMRWRWPASAALLWFVAVAVLIALVDFETMLIPDRLNAVGLLGGLAALIAVALANGQADRISRMAVGALTFTLVLGLAHVVYPAGLGFGDVKAAPLLGAFLGWSGDSMGAAAGRVLGALLLASFAASVVGVVLLVGWRSRREFPFGPALVGGTLVMLLAFPNS